MKVLHLPTSIAGNPLEISEAERKIGIDSNVLVLFKDKYLPDVSSIFDAPPQNPLQLKPYLKKMYGVWREIRGSDIDVLHFNFSRSLLDYPGLVEMWDLGTYPNKKIFVTTNGCDVRIRDVASRLPFCPCTSYSCTNRVCQSQAFDVVKKSRTSRWNQYANGIFAATPDLLRYLPPRAKYIPNTVYGWDHIKEVSHKDIGPLVIIHAPTNRHIKGTGYIIDAVNKLERKYPGQIKFISIEGKARKEALEIYRYADIAIDQLRLGWYGVFAIECMKMGIPTISYYRKEECGMIPKEMADQLKTSLINATPVSIYDVLERCLCNRESLVDRSRNGIAFVERWHSPKYVATLLKKEYDA